MADSFKVAVAGPARVGKTTLLTAVLSDTEEMLAETPVSISLGETTEARIRRQKIDLRRAIEAGVFNAAALGGTQAASLYELTLRADGDLDIEAPFTILDYPGGWLNPEMRARSAEARQQWPRCEAHIKNSIMLLLPIDAAVLMEAATPAQRSAVVDLLGLIDVEALALKWARARSARPTEPAVVVFAPLKCEKYFDDNGGIGRDAQRLRQQVEEKYRNVLTVIHRETAGRGVRVVYAPIDTYGCVQLMETEWPDLGADGPGHLEFIGRYRFRSRRPVISVKAAGTVMQELCRCIISSQVGRKQQDIDLRQQAYTGLLDRKAADKGFWGTLGYYLGGEAWENREDRRRSQEEIAAASRQREQLAEALHKLAAAQLDKRVEVW